MTPPPPPSPLPPPPPSPPPPPPPPPLPSPFCLDDGEPTFPSQPKHDPQPCHANPRVWRGENQKGRQVFGDLFKNLEHIWRKTSSSGSCREVCIQDFERARSRPGICSPSWRRSFLVDPWGRHEILCSSAEIQSG
jgi:hypothetical protein